MTEQEVPPIEPTQESPSLAPHPESVYQLSSSVPETAPAVSGTIADPWLRYFARFVDLQIWGLFLALMIGLLFPSWFEDNAFLGGQLGSRLFGWALVPFALIIDAASYHFFGNTPAKAIAGIKIKSLAGEKVSFLTYLKRNFGLYWFGLGADIPIVVLVTMGRNYSIAEGNETVRWDESTGTRAFIKSKSTLRLVIMGVIWLLFFLFEIVGVIF